MDACLRLLSVYKHICTPCMLLARVASPVHRLVVLAFYAAIQYRRHRQQRRCALAPT